MPSIITDLCTKDGACVDVCPTNCIFEGDTQYYINPDDCVDCGQCIDVCPSTAIFSEDDLPADKQQFIELNAVKGRELSK